jgi:hypothetical protein
MARRWLWHELGALAVASIFAVHPLATEVVSNVAGRSDLLVAFTLLAILELHAWRPAAGSLQQWLRRSGLALAALAGVLFKESAVVAIPLMVLDDMACRWRRRPASGADDIAECGNAVSPSAVDVVLLAEEGTIARRSGLAAALGHVDWGDYLVVVPSVVLLIAIRFWVSWTTPVVGQSVEDNPIVMAVSATQPTAADMIVGFFTARMTAIKVIGYYLGLVFWPARLSCDYSWHQIPLFSWSFSGTDLHGWLALVVVILLVAVGLRARRRQPVLFFFLSMAFVAFLPTANLVMAIGTIMGERLMYLPLAALLAAAVAVLVACGRGLARRSSGTYRYYAGCAVVLGPLVITLLACRTYYRNKDWHSDETLWRAAVKTCPESYKVYKGLAGAISDVDPDSERIDESLGLVQQGVAIIRRWRLPGHHVPSGLFCDLAADYVRKGDKIIWRSGVPGSMPEAAWSCYTKALEGLQPALKSDEEVNQASRSRREKMGKDPNGIPDVGMFEIYDLLAKVHYRLGRFKEGIVACHYLCHLQPSRGRSYRLLARLYCADEQWAEAAVADLQSVILGDDDPTVVADLAQIYAHLRSGESLIVMADGKPSLDRNNPLARAHLERACRGLVQIFLDAKRPADALVLREKAIKDLRCKEDVFAGLLPQP